MIVEKTLEKTKSKDELFKEIQLFLEQFPEYKIDGRTIKERLAYSDISLWWFFQRRFMRDAMPSQFDNMGDIIKQLSDNQFPSLLQRTKSSMKTFLSRKMLKYNEMLKLFLVKHAYKKPIQTNKPNVLFPVYTNALIFEKDGIKVDRIQLLIDEVKKQGMNPVIRILSPFSHKLSKKSLNFGEFFYSYADKNLMSVAHASAKKIFNEWTAIRSRLPLKSHLEKLMYSLFSPALDFFFSKEMIELAVLHYELSKKVLQQEKINAVVLNGPANIMERCLIAAADSLGIPSITVPHGIGFTNTKWDLPKSHYFFVPGELQKKRFAIFGANPKNLFVIGATFFPDLKNYSGTTKQKNNKKKQVLFCTAPIVEENAISKELYFSHMRRYLSEMSKLSDTQIIIKPHPLERNVDEYEKIISNIHAQNISIVRSKLGKEQLYELIGSCDVFLTFFSTTIWEANALDKPTVMIDLYDKKNIDTLGWFHKYSKPVIKVKPDADVSVVINRLLNDTKLLSALKEERKKFLSDYLYKIDGKGQERAAKIIKQLAMHAVKK